MLSLKTEGYAALICGVARDARARGSAADVIRSALTLCGRVDEDVGLAALTAADLAVIEVLRHSDARLDPDAEDGGRLFLTNTARLAVRPEGTEPPLDAHPLGAVLLGAEESADLASRWRSECEGTGKVLRALRAELAGEPAEQVLARIDRIEHAVMHMAPVQIYVNEHVYSNLGKTSNLPGKSLSAGHERSVLTVLRGKPIADWAPEDACFVACLSILLQSGPPVRAEEFNGVQIYPARLARFLRGEALPAGDSLNGCESPDLGTMERLAAACARRRAAIESDRLPFRYINGLNLHKREQHIGAPKQLADMPAGLATHVSALLGGPPIDSAHGGACITDLAARAGDLAARLVRMPAPDGFGSAFEYVLHAFVAAAAEAFAADVAMSRGPQRWDELRARPIADPLALDTGDFFCCVAPRQAFADRFGADRLGLIRTLSAYSARMRFNSWHYLPHTLGATDGDQDRDWFFAPTMPDLADWSDQHHTGHVVFGVRYAIRVPIGIDYDGRYLPGLCDLRFMRTQPPPFTTADLRQAVAAAKFLRLLYQAISVYEPIVSDFGKTWYERRYG